MSSDSLLLTLCVRGNGIGLLEAQVEPMARPLHRGASAFNDPYAGADSGLALVQQYVFDLRGEMVCKSSLGAGCTFNVHIPLKRAV